MNKSKCISVLVIIVSLVLAFFINSFNVAVPNTGDIKILYSSKSCTSCQKLERYLEENDIKIETVYIEDNREIFKESEIKSLPTLELNSGENIETFNNIEKYLKDNEIKNKKQTAAIGIWAVLTAALIDSINPCAIASLIFILAYFKQNKDKKSILASGMLFGATIFLVYLLIGFAIIVFQKTLTAYSLFPKILGTIVIFICIYGIYESVQNIVKESMRCKGGICRIDDLPEDQAIKAKNKLLNNKSVILTGVVVAFSEFACTGQVYIPTLALSGTSPKAMMYLVIYNIIFILPIFVITLFYGYLQSDKLTNQIEKNKKILMYLNLLLFVFLFIISFSYYFI